MVFFLPPTRFDEHVSSLPKTLVFSLIGFIGFGLFVFLLTSSVVYLPYGVPESRLQEYEEKIREIKAYAELERQADPSTLPVATVDQTMFDFGMVDPHKTLSHRFTVRNDGQVPLQLKVRETSCKCTVGELDASVLLPAEQTNVMMTWNTGYQADQYEQTATIITNDPLAKEILLKVKGEIRAEFVAPESIAFHVADMGEAAESSFLVYSQLWSDFTIADVESDLENFEWLAEPISVNHAMLADSEARSAWEVRVFSANQEYGKFSGKISIQAEPVDGGEPVVRDLTCSGKVRAPINFYGPDIHRSEGLDIGTIVSGEEREFHLVVRARTDVQRKIEVLDVKPDELNATLEPLATTGSYRLTLKVPKDCPMVVFNAAQKHGYVQVGDPLNKQFSNWFPVHGAVVTLQE